MKVIAIELKPYQSNNTFTKLNYAWKCLYRYQTALKISQRGSNFVFDWLNLLQCKYHKINLNRGESNADSSDYTETKAAINPINDNDKCFQYTATVTLNHEEIGKKIF